MGNSLKDIICGKSNMKQVWRSRLGQIPRDLFFFFHSVDNEIPLKASE